MSARDFYNEASQDPNNLKNYNYKSSDNQYPPQNWVAGPNATQDRGLLSTVVGGAGGYYAGSKISNNHSKLSGVLGAVGGALLANKLSDKFENRHDHQHNQAGRPNGSFNHEPCHHHQESQYNSRFTNESHHNHHHPPPQPHPHPHRQGNHRHEQHFGGIPEFRNDGHHNNNHDEFFDYNQGPRW